MTIRAVVFDLGNVFVDVVHARASSALGRFCSDGPQRLEAAITASSLLHRIERGEIEPQVFHAELAGHASCSATFEDFCAAFCDIFVTVPEMIAANAGVRARGTPTYLCSNTSVLHFEHLERNHAFMRDFDDYFLSYRVRSMKPEKEIYRAVEKGTKRSGAELLFIDDKLENVDAAAALGWEVIHHVSPAATIERLRALDLLPA